MARARIAEADLRAGAAQVDITPRMGTQIAGDIGRHRPAELVVEPIYARALVLEAGGRKACILSLDVGIITPAWVAEIRRQAHEKFGLAPETVMVHAVQNHAAPGIGHFMIAEESKYVPPGADWLRGGDDRYAPFAVERILETVGKANGALEPVSVGAASGLEARVAFNRRFVMRDGTVKTHPGWQDAPNILHAEGPIDPELGVVAFVAEDLRIPAMMLHYTCHPVHGYPQRYVSGGWPGIWCTEVQKAHGEGCVPLVINGCCGNIHHCNHLDPSFVDDYRNMGRLLAQTSERVLVGVRYEREAVLDWRQSHVSIPYRPLPAKFLKSVDRLLAEHPEPMWRDEAHTAVEWDWVYAVAIKDLHARQQKDKVCRYEVQAFRVGNIALLALGGEPFVEGQLAIKMQSPTRWTYIAHNSNGFCGYVPTRAALKRGGYETRTSTWSQLAPQALDVIVDESVRLLKQLFPGRPGGRKSKGVV